MHSTHMANSQVAAAAAAAVVVWTGTRIAMGIQIAKINGFGTSIFLVVVGFLVRAQRKIRQSIMITKYSSVNPVGQSRLLL
jgi:hypothetical protein